MYSGNSFEIANAQGVHFTVCIILHFRKSTDVSTISQIPKPNKSLKEYPESEPLFTQDMCVNESFDLFTSTQIGKGNCEPPVKLPHTIKKLDGSPFLLNPALTRKIVMGRGMSPRCTSSPVQSPVGQRKAQNYEDLWTDEEMFDDDSFVMKATQGDMFATPRAIKRRNPDTTPASNPKVPKHKFNVKSVSPIHKQTEADKASCLPVQSYQTVNQKQLPFQSYYEKNKSQTSIAGSQYIQNNKENVTSSSRSISTVQNKQGITSKPANKCVIVPAKRISSTQVLVNNIQSKVESRTQIPTTNSVIMTHSRYQPARPTGASTVRSVMGPPVITSKPLNGAKQNGFVGTDSQYYPRGALIMPVRPTVGNTQIYPATSKRENSSTRPLTSSSLTSSQRFDAPLKQKAETISSKSNMVKLSDPSFGSKGNQKPIKTPPRVSTLTNDGRSPGQFNTSFTDELLATLAEPDDILDSQVEKFGSPCSPKSDNDDLDNMASKAIDIGLELAPSKSGIPLQIIRIYQNPQRGIWCRIFEKKAIYKFSLSTFCWYLNTCIRVYVTQNFKNASCTYKVVVLKQLCL